MTEYEKFITEIGLAGRPKYPSFDSGELKKTMHISLRRDEGIKKYAYAILTEEAIEKLRLYAPILEVGAGTGYWAYEFQKRGIDYIATDPDPCGSQYFKGSEQWAPIEGLSGVEAVTKYPDRTMLTCWPSYSDSWAYEAALAYSGNTLIYVGESDGGCTADDNFHAELNKNWKLDQGIGIPQWWGIHDNIFVYKRKK